jgi:hypothetical protein
MLDKKFKPKKDGSGFIVTGLVTVIPSKLELKLLKWVMLAKYNDDSRPALMNVNFTENGMSATDGFRLHKIVYPDGYVSSFPVGLHFICAVHNDMVILEPYTGSSKYPETEETSSKWKQDGIQLKHVGDENKYAAIFAIYPKYMRDALALAKSNEAFVELRGGPLYVNYKTEYNFQVEAFVMLVCSSHTKELATGQVVSETSNYVIQKVS